MAENEKPVTIDAERARAGATPRMTRYILAASLTLVIVIFAIILWV
ncbi:MAG: hypothetical protein ACOY45_15925 [Pseudomonadota bacterium]